MTLITIIWLILFAVIAVLDWRYHRISNYLIFPAVVLAVMALITDTYVDSTFYSRLFIPSNSLLSGISYAVIAGAIFIIAASVDYGLMGMGDVKLIVLISLVLGFPRIIFAVLISAIVALIAIGVLLKRGKTLKSMLPLGAFLSVGTIIALLLPDSFVRMVF